MNAPRCRPFNVVDGMILVAATAVGLALTPDHWSRDIKWSWQGMIDPYYDATGAVVRGFISVWLSWTISFAICRLRQPRPSLRRLRYQPGLVACQATLSLLVLAVFYDILAFAITKQGFYITGYLPFQMSFLTPPLVGGSWLTLWYVRRWKPEPGWIDRMGRLLGWGWIALLLVYKRMLDNRVAAQ